KPDAYTPAEKPADAAARDTGLTALVARPHFETAAAALEVLAADPAPAPHRVRFLDALLTSQEARPRYAETLLVRRLALLARDRGPGVLSSAPARLLVELTRDFQALAALPDAAAVLQGRLDALAQQRHDAEALVFAPGYAPAADADR